MKRRDVLRHLQRHNCSVLREGGSHTIVGRNDKPNSTALPRHSEINDYLVKKSAATLKFLSPEQ
jgi:mRNA interferase HicA